MLSMSTGYKGHEMHTIISSGQNSNVRLFGSLSTHLELLKHFRWNHAIKAVDATWLTAAGCKRLKVTSIQNLLGLNETAVILGYDNCDKVFVQDVYEFGAITKTLIYTLEQAFPSYQSGD